LFDVDRLWWLGCEDEDVVEVVGVYIYWVKFAVYVVGAIWGGLVGVFFGV